MKIASELEHDDSESVDADLSDEESASESDEKSDAASPGCAAELDDVGAV